jgi:toxin YoeB
MYRIIVSKKAEKDIKTLQRSEPQVYKKLQTFIIELREHPMTGTGHPKPLVGDLTGRWSRRITDKHRLVYRINDKEIIVLVLSVKGHYEDK